LTVVNGEGGNPSLLYKFAPSGLSAHAYLTVTGLLISSLHAVTLLPLMIAFAHTNFLSGEAI